MQQLLVAAPDDWIQRIEVAKVKAVDPDTKFSVEGTDGCSFAHTSSKKGLNFVERNYRNLNNQNS